MKLASAFLTTTSELKAFNRVRMLHNVVSLADFTSANEKNLTLSLPLAQHMKATGTTSNGPLHLPAEFLRATLHL